MTHWSQRGAQQAHFSQPESRLLLRSRGARRPSDPIAPRRRAACARSSPVTGNTDEVADVPSSGSAHRGRGRICRRRRRRPPRPSRPGGPRPGISRRGCGGRSDSLWPVADPTVIVALNDHQVPILCRCPNSNWQLLSGFTEEPPHIVSPGPSSISIEDMVTDTRQHST